MRVLHVVAPSAVGGIERVVQLLSVAQRDAGDAVRVVAISSAAEREAIETFLAPLESAGVETDHVVIPGRGYQQERAALEGLCGVASPDIAHTHGYRVDVVDGATVRKCGVPVVATAHGFVGGGVRNRGYEWLQRRALRRYHGVAAVSRGVAEKLVSAGVPAARVRVLPNAWRASQPALSRDAARAELGITEPGFRIGWIGRVEREKGLDVLLDALALMRDDHPHLSVIGDGSRMPAMRARAAALGLTRITWHGVVPCAERVLAAFDVLALSSRTEGVPMVLLEAMASELPIVATRVGGVPDTVSDREALLVAPEDPGALAVALQSVQAEPRAAAARARAALGRVTRDFGVDAWVAAYRSLYLDAMTHAELQ